MSTRDEQYREYLERHRAFVLQEAIKLGIRDRGTAHDRSKYLADEFGPYAEYFYGGHERGKVPPKVQQEFDHAWLLHQKRNDHHWQYWVLREDSGATKVLCMSEGAMKEMLADWRGAGMAITGVDNTAAWFSKNRADMLLHPDVVSWICEQLGLKT